MFEWLKIVNKKKLHEDPSLQSNQPKEGNIKIDDELSIDISISPFKQEGKIEIIKKF